MNSAQPTSTSDPAFTKNACETEAIVAISTAPGAAAIGIVRLSGPALEGIVSRTFQSSRPLNALRDRKAHLGKFLDEAGQVLDEGLLLWFAAPTSYTGEDVVEMQVHGNPWILERLMAAVMAAGARAAEPGEFTRRAYMNGRLDLIQADAVIQIIQASSAQALQAARRLLSGELSRKVQAWRDELISVLAQLELQIDFPEEDELYASGEWLEARLARLGADVAEVVESYKRGSRARKGVKVVLCGRPNVGKSSLFNALLGYRRAIVSPRAGTTRDLVEGECELEGIKIQLQDTAGLRDSEDEVEVAGLEMTGDALSGAELVLVVMDAAEGQTEEDGEVLRRVKELGVDWVGVWNKADLDVNGEKIGAEEGWIRLSARTGEGIERLREAMVSRLVIREESAGLLLTAAWQREVLSGLKEALAGAAHVIHNNLLPTAASFELLEGLALLDRMTGADGRNDLMNTIFAQFCLGK